MPASRRVWDWDRVTLAGKAGLTLKVARAKADEALALLHHDKDPAEVKQAAKALRETEAAAKTAAAAAKAPVVTFKRWHTT